MLQELVGSKYTHDLAPGVYDVHSPVVPPVEDMAQRLRKFSASDKVVERFWVVPDCGLKTRKWDEVRPALVNMVKAAQLVRGELAVA